jgi:hypothetical protein
MQRTTQPKPQVAPIIIELPTCTSAPQHHTAQLFSNLTLILLHNLCCLLLAPDPAVYRATAVGAGPMSFATVESDPVTLNPDRRKETVKPRGWSAQDLGNLVGAAAKGSSVGRKV